MRTEERIAIIKALAQARRDATTHGMTAMWLIIAARMALVLGMTLEDLRITCGDIIVRDYEQDLPT